MKKQLINGLLILAMFFVSVGTFSSCKDNSEDDMAQVKTELQKKIDALQQVVDNLKSCACPQIEGLTQENWDKIQDAIANGLTEDQINDLIKDYAVSKTDYDDLKKLVEDLQKINNDVNVTINGQSYSGKDLSELLNALNIYIQGAYDKIDQVNTDLGGKINGLDQSIQDLQKELGDLKGDIKKGVDAWTWIEKYRSILENMEKTISDLNLKDEDLQKQITELKNQFNDYKLTTDLRLETIESTMEDYGKRIEANEQAIEELKREVEKLTGLVDRLNKLVTGIIIQATNNPVLGSVNLPLDVNSNMLLAQYGYAQTNFTFPSNSSAAEYNNEIVFTAKDIEMLNAAGLKTLRVNNGDALLDGGPTKEGTGYANAGTVYLTINPNNINFDGVQLSLVNSQDAESPIKLEYAQKSNKVLTFGVSRSAENNGFYEIQGTLKEADIEKAKVDIEPGLKSAIKDVANNKDASSLSKLAQILYNQFNGKLEANALKAAWTAQDGEGNEKEYATYSKYGIAAAAYKPLSFKFYYGQAAPASLRLPIISPLTGNYIDASKFNFHFTTKGLNLNNITIDLSGIKIDDVNSTIQVTLTGSDSYGNTITVTGPADASQLVKELQAKLDGQLADKGKEIEKQINDLIAQINDQVKQMMDDIAGQINGQIKDLVDDINAEINGKLPRINNYIEKYNQVANKINSMLENPNAYLQVMMCYKGADGVYHHLSNSKTYPTVMQLAGGNAVELLPTTYTGEIFASAFKKFVAVTNVWDANGNSAQGGDATCLAALKDANSNNELINQPITGTAHRVPVKLAKAGYTYEIVYSALDYSGFTSTRKFYITVK